MAETVFNRVESLLKQHGTFFQVLRHDPVYTSEEAARVRGTPLATGAKALIVKGEEGFVMFVVPATENSTAMPSAAPKAGRKCDSPRGKKSWN